jgi:hypothetical protein
MADSSPEKGPRLSVNGIGVQDKQFAVPLQRGQQDDGKPVHTTTTADQTGESGQAAEKTAIGVRRSSGGCVKILSNPIVFGPSFHAGERIGSTVFPAPEGLKIHADGKELREEQGDCRKRAASHPAPIKRSGW